MTQIIGKNDNRLIEVKDYLGTQADQTIAIVIQSIGDLCSRFDPEDPTITPNITLFEPYTISCFLSMSKEITIFDKTGRFIYPFVITQMMQEMEGSVRHPKKMTIYYPEGTDTNHYPTGSNITHTPISHQGIQSLAEQNIHDVLIGDKTRYISGSLEEIANYNALITHPLYEKTITFLNNMMPWFAPMNPRPEPEIVDYKSITGFYDPAGAVQLTMAIEQAKMLPV